MSLFSILLLSNIILSLNYIKIPFERTYKEKITKKNYIEHLLNSELTCKIPIGTPQQIIPFHIKLNKYATFISSSSIKEISNIIKFNEIESTSYEKKSDKINYYSPNQEFSYGIESIDNFNIKNDKKKNLNKKIQFILATSLRKNESAGLGLDINIPKGQNLLQFNLINQLKENNDINSYGFSFYFENNNYYLILGAYPNEYNSNYDIEDFLKIQIQIEGYNINWRIKTDKIIYNNKTLSNYKVISLEPSIKTIIGTKSFYLNVTNDFFNEYLNLNKCKSKIINGNILDENGEYLFFYCDNDIDIKKFKSISFVFNGFNYQLSYKELFESFENEIYFLVGFKYEDNNISDKQNWIMGEPFFSKNILVFDQNNKIIGIYTKTKKRISFSFIFLIFIIFILIVIIISLIFYFYRYIRSHRKIRANELDDNFEYIPQN